MDLKLKPCCIVCLKESHKLKTLTTQQMDDFKNCSGVPCADDLFKIGHQICKKCSSRLSDTFTFQQQCQASYTKLKERYSLLVKSEPLDADVEGHTENLVIMNLQEGAAADACESVETMEAEFMCYYCDAILATHKDYVVHREKHVVETTTVAKARSISRVCQLCGQHQVGYIKHLESEHKDYCPNKCKQCPKQFRSPKLLKTHLFKHLQSKNFQCLGCYRTFKSHGQRRSHLVWDKHDTGVYRCPACGLGCEQFIALHQHYQKEHSSQSTRQLYPCFECRAVFCYTKQYRQHKCPEAGKRRTQVDQLPKDAPIYTCDRCQARFGDEDEMVCHKFTECVARSKCPECGKVLENRHALQNHLRRHEQQGQFICEVCAFSACSAPKLALHKAKHQPVDRTTYLKCPHPGCVAELKSEFTLQSHMRRHSEGQYECDLCKRKFRHRAVIQRHMTTEHMSAEQLKYGCECGKRFFTARELRIHARLHSEDRPMRCQMCPSAYRDRHNLLAHMRRVHQGVYYECIYCDKRYMERMAMKEHLFFHLDGVKPFNCSECPAQFVKRFLIIEHLHDKHKMAFDLDLHGNTEKERNMISEMLQFCRKEPQPLENTEKN